jgi:hypothetical protein
MFFTCDAYAPLFVEEEEEPFVELQLSRQRDCALAAASTRRATSCTTEALEIGLEADSQQRALRRCL